MSSTATVFNIERFSSEDGPGIRTVVFLKGCSLRCKWCANPESQSPRPQILHKPAICVGCRRCLACCPCQAIMPTPAMGLASDTAKCLRCSACVDACYVGARVLMGEEYSAETLFAEIMKDNEYFRSSGGGVTFSGGEPLLHDDFIVEFSSLATAANLNVLVETCGQVRLDSVKKMDGVADAIFYDVKHMDPKKHQQLTGSGNAVILENLRWLNKHYHGFLSVRYPYIPGMNDAPGDVSDFIDFVAGLDKVRELWFLPYHRLGLSKYQGLGLNYEMGDAKPLRVADLEFLKQYQDRLSIPIRI